MMVCVTSFMDDPKKLKSSGHAIDKQMKVILYLMMTHTEEWKWTQKRDNENKIYFKCKSGWENPFCLCLRGRMVAHTLPLSLFHTHTHTQTHNIHTLFLTLTHTHTQTHLYICLSHTHTPFLSLCVSLSLILTHTHTHLSLSLSHRRTHKHIFSLPIFQIHTTHTHTHTHKSAERHSWCCLIGLWAMLANIHTCRLNQDRRSFFNTKFNPKTLITFLVA